MCNKFWMSFTFQVFINYMWIDQNEEYITHFTKRKSVHYNPSVASWPLRPMARKWKINNFIVNQRISDAVFEQWVIKPLWLPAKTVYLKCIFISPRAMMATSLRMVAMDKYLSSNATSMVIHPQINHHISKWLGSYGHTLFWKSELSKQMWNKWRNLLDQTLPTPPTWHGGRTVNKVGRVSIDVSSKDP